LRTIKDEDERTEISADWKKPRDYRSSQNEHFEVDTQYHDDNLDCTESTEGTGGLASLDRMTTHPEDFCTGFIRITTSSWISVRIPADSRSSGNSSGTLMIQGAFVIAPI
jgi:hypothetical protein